MFFTIYITLDLTLVWHEFQMKKMSEKKTDSNVGSVPSLYFH